MIIILCYIFTHTALQNIVELPIINVALLSNLNY